MSDPYVGWDGKQYPWPPPEGWYHASDGRWWAPDTGPNPPPPATTDRPATQPRGPGAGADRDTTAELKRSSLNVDATATSLPVANPIEDARTIGLSDQDSTNNTSIEAAELPEGETPTADGPGSRLLTPARLGLVAGAVVALVVAVVALSFLRSSSPETRSEAIGSETDSTAATTPAVPTTTILTVENVRSIGQFRLALTDNELTTENLTDEDIVSFASSFCGLAESSDDREEFEDIRAGTVASSTSELSQKQLSLIVDAAVITFCPDEAERLEISP